MESVTAIITPILLTGIVNTTSFLVVFIALVVVFFLIGLVLGLSINVRRHIANETKAPTTIQTDDLSPTFTNMNPIQTANTMNRTDTEKMVIPNNIVKNTTPVNANINNNLTLNHLQQTQSVGQSKKRNSRRYNTYTNYNQWPYSATNFTKHNSRRK